jgi:DNA processing protein
MTEEQQDILSLFCVPGIGAKTFAKLVRVFGSAGAVFSASDNDLLEVEGIGPVVSRNIRTLDRKKIVGEQRKIMDRVGAVMLTRQEKDYPPQLNAFPSAPPVLFVRGDISALQLPSLAFVGTRKPSSWGVSMTGKLASGAVHAGYCVTSGMASGIDTAAHRTAVEENGKTTAVFGCGVDTIYPPENRRLSEDIIRSGCLVSHFLMGTKCSPGNFPARNAVIVGLSLGTVVVEAPMKSGALITADLALKAKRHLFTVPGNADSETSKGTNNLLSRGAHPISNIENIISTLGHSIPMNLYDKQSGSPMIKHPLPPGLGGGIIKALESGPLQVESLCSKLGEPVQKILNELTLLEMDGFVRQKPGKVFEKI